MKGMKISREAVQYVAGLARLDLSEEETERFTLQLNTVLSYMDKLNELDTSSVECMSHVIDVFNAFRRDMTEESFSQDVTLLNAPEKENGFFKVPKIIED